TAFDRIVGVPERVIFVKISQRRADAALSRSGMAAGWIKFADNGDIRAAFGGIERRHQACTARADHHHLELMYFHHKPLKSQKVLNVIRVVLWLSPVR